MNSKPFWCIKRSNRTKIDRVTVLLAMPCMCWLITAWACYARRSPTIVQTSSTSSEGGDFKEWSEKEEEEEEEDDEDDDDDEDSTHY